MRRLTLLVLLSSCGPPPQAGPDETLRTYLAAVAANKIDAAYALMSAEYLKTHDRAAFARAIAAGDKGLAARAKDAKVALYAEAELDEHETLPLVFEHGAWRIARDPLDFYPQRAPEETLRSFIRAVEARRYDVVLRFVPQRYRATLTLDKLRERWEGEKRAELLEQLQQVRAHLGEPFDLTPSGDEARLPLAERHQARLVREEDVWRVEALE